MCVCACMARACVMVYGVGIAYASVRIAHSSFNIISQNYFTGNLAHGLEVGQYALDNIIQINQFINAPQHGKKKRRLAYVDLLA